MIPNKEFLTLVPIGQYYQDYLPSVEDGFQQSYAHEQSTLARIEKMKREALFRGQLITLKSKAHEQESAKLFKEPFRAKKENLPVIKMKDIEALKLSAEGLAKRPPL